MKKTFNIIHRPKIVIPATIVVAIIIGIVGYIYVGRTPIVSVPAFSDSSDMTGSSSLSTSQTISQNGSYDLSFPKTGRVESVSANVGNSVKKGDILAALEAGDALGVVTQTKGALELAKAQYASLDVQYANTKKQQDTLVENTRRTLWSSGLEAKAVRKPTDVRTSPVDSSQAPTVTGSYTCDKEGSYLVEPYRSGEASGYSFTFEGLERGNGGVAFFNPQPLGSCGLSIQFPEGYSSDVNWTVKIPNTDSSVYVTNKNAYDLAVATRDQVLKQFEANLGQNGSSAANTAQAAVNAAEGAYQTALGAYQNDLITAPADGVVTFIDSHLKVGQAVTANKSVISISTK